ncbi:MAG: type II/IV secretion system protein, partial [Staphylococcus epidermidis]|nr:type II/IV secretion system protein [Staphylococcus epidermidis]
MKILFEQIINHAIKQEASDIHFIPCEEHTIIKLRIKDELTIYDRL